MIKIIIKTTKAAIAIYQGETLTYNISAAPDYYLTITVGVTDLAIFKQWESFDYITITEDGTTTTTVTNENPVVIDQYNTATAAQAEEIITNTETILSTMALEATLTAIKGDGWTIENLKAVYDLIVLVNTYIYNTIIGVHEITDGKIDALNNLSVSQVWSYATRTLTNVDNVWTVSARSLTDKTNFLLASAEYDNIRKSVCLTGDTTNSIGKILYDFYVTRLTATRCGNLDTIPSLALEATLTTMKGTGWSTETLKNIRDAITALNNITAQNVWEYGTRTLTNVDNVWSVSTRALTDKANFTLASAEYDNIRKSVCLTGDTASSIGKILFDLNANYTSTRAGYLDYLANGTYGLNALYTLLTNGTYGLSPLQVLIAAIKTKTDIIGGSVALESGGNLATVMGKTNLIPADITTQLDTNVPAIKNKTDLIPADIVTQLDTNIPAIKAKTDLIPADITTALDTTLPARSTQTSVDALENKLKASPSVDSILYKSGGTALASSKSYIDTLLLDPSLDKLIQTKSTCKASCTTNLLQTNLTEATDDHYKGMCVIFTSGNLAGQTSIITFYNGTTKEITVDPALIETPANTNAFVILGVGVGKLRYGSKGLEQIYDLVDTMNKLKRIGYTITTDGTEQTIFIMDAPAYSFIPLNLLIDTTAHTATETLVINIYLRVKSGGNYILFKTTTFTAVQSPLGQNIDLLPNLYGIKITVNKTAGTNRAYDYEVWMGER